MYYQAKSGDVSIIQRIPPYGGDQGKRCITQPQASDDRLIEQIIDHYSRALVHHEQARRFLLTYGIFGHRLLSDFRLGYCDRTLGLRLQRLERDQEAYTRGALQRLGLLKPSGHEFFRGCVVFPFLDTDGSITGAYGKRITPKLRAGSVYQVHWITERTRFFNERTLIDAREVILCKNPLEALIWWQQGFQRVIALMGCHAFTQAHLDLLRRYRIERVYLALGGTAVELKAMRTIAVELNRANIAALMLLFPDGQDASHFFLTTARPQAAFAALLAQAIRVTAFDG